MSVAIMSEYRPKAGHRDEFLELLRAEHERAASLGARISAYQVTSGGESTGHVMVTLEFATAVERGEFGDQSARGQSALADALWAADPPAVLVARYSANGIPLRAAPPETPPPVTSELRLRTTAGRQVDVEAAIDEFKQTREALGITVRQWSLVSAGTSHGVRILSTGAASFAESATQQDRINAYAAERGAPNGALSRAQQTGAVTVIESRQSRLIAEL
jgi:hypothetical protein